MRLRVPCSTNWATAGLQYGGIMINDKSIWNLINKHAIHIKREKIDIDFTDEAPSHVYMNAYIIISVFIVESC